MSLNGNEWCTSIHIFVERASEGFVHPHFCCSTRSMWFMYRQLADTLERTLACLLPPLVSVYFFFALSSSSSSLSPVCPPPPPQKKNTMKTTNKKISGHGPGSHPTSPDSQRHVPVGQPERRNPGHHGAPNVQRSGLRLARAVQQAHDPAPQTEGERKCGSSAVYVYVLVVYIKKQAV